MANINKIRVSGTTYNIEDTNATKTAEVSQAQYDALVAAGTLDSNTFYIITDAEYFDPSNYYTSAQTQSAITQAVSGKQDTLISGTNIKTINNESILGSGNITIQGGGVDTGTVQTMIDESISGKTDTSAFTAHTGDSTIHVTSSEKQTWNAKSNFSGSYNDLTDKPTIPTSASQLTNDAGYATSGYVDSAVSGKANSSDVYTKSETSGATEIATALSGKQDTLSAGTNITIVDNVISAEGGGKAVAAGTNISITTGETADTVSCTLPLTITGNDNTSLIRTNQGGTVSQKRSFAYGTNLTISPYDYSNSAAFGTDNSIGGQAAFVCGRNNTISNLGGFGFACGEHNTIGYYSTGGHIEGGYNNIDGQAKYAHSEGYYTRASKSYSHTEGFYTIASNQSEHASGQYNISSTASTTFGNSGNTLFSVGNGTSTSARHNAFEIRQNGDIYCSDGTNDVKLQDTITATAANTTALGGLKLVKLTQSEYDNLSTKDNSTLYVIVN